MMICPDSGSFIRGSDNVNCNLAELGQPLNPELKFRVSNQQG